MFWNSFCNAGAGGFSACCPSASVFPAGHPTLNTQCHCWDAEGTVFLHQTFKSFESSSLNTEQSGALSCWGINPLPDTLSGCILPSSLLSALTFVTSLCLAATNKRVTKLSGPREATGNGPSSDCSPECRLVFPTLLSLQHCVHVNLSDSNKLYVNS